MIETYSGFTVPIGRLFELANTSCEQAAFKSACERFAVSAPALSDEWSLRFSLGDHEEPLLVVCLSQDSPDQSAFDVQFGLDVAYWVVPWTGADPRPESPFVDWLIRHVRSRSRPP